MEIKLALKNEVTTVQLSKSIEFKFIQLVTVERKGFTISVSPFPRKEPQLRPLVV